MAFQDASEFPRGRFHIEDLTNTAQTVSTDHLRVAGVHLYGGAADEIVIFRANDDSPVYFQHAIAATASEYIPIKFFAEDGLEVITASAAGDVHVTVFFYDPSSKVLP